MFLLSITNELKVPIILLHHFRKGSKTDEPKYIDEIRGNAKLSDSADTVLQLWRPTQNDGSDNFSSNALTVITMKDRGWGSSWRGDIYFKNGTFFDSDGVVDSTNQEEFSIDDLPF
jgi:hypothetical protein